MELVNNLNRGYRDFLKWASAPESQKTLKLMAIFALSISLAYGIGYLSAKNSNPAPIVIQTNS